MNITLDSLIRHTNVLMIQINNNVLLNSADVINQLRDVELSYYSVNNGGVQTTIIFNNLYASQTEAQFQMFTTLFITIILVVS